MAINGINKANTIVKQYDNAAGQPIIIGLQPQAVQVASRLRFRKKSADFTISRAPVVSSPIEIIANYGRKQFVLQRFAN